MVDIKPAEPTWPAMPEGNFIYHSDSELEDFDNDNTTLDNDIDNPFSMSGSFRRGGL